MTNVYDLPMDALLARFAELGLPAYRARQVYTQLWRRGVVYEDMTDLPRSLRGRLSEQFPARLEVVTEREADDGATRKGLLRLGERHLVETVVMGYPDRLLDPAGMDLAARHVTVSTVGVVPGIRRLGVDHPQVGLAVSLHAADDELRNELVAVNRLWPLEALVEAVTEWRDRTHRRPSIEWTMMRGVNDDDGQARLLATIALGLRAHVNLIPMNPHPRERLPAELETAYRRVHGRASEPRRAGHGSRHQGPGDRGRLRPAPLGARGRELAGGNRDRQPLRAAPVEVA